jgi:polysaccharide chain length determinant protein (PEP-CTERM system associated)
MEMSDYLDILRRRKWLIIFSFLFILFGAFAYSVTAMELYKSQTTILVTPQRVPEGYVRSTVSARIDERLATIQQQVMSRTRLTTVMDELGMYKAERKKVPVEGIVMKMRKRIQIQVSSMGRRSEGGEAFSLTFIDENPQMAMLVASRLASFFIDENLKTREQQAVGTSEFLESQLQEIKEKLEAKEETLKEYKLRFMGELPQQLQANLQTLSRLQEQLRINSDASRMAHDRKAVAESQHQSLKAQLGAIQAQMAAAVSAESPGGGIPTMVNPSDLSAALVQALNTKKGQLATLSAKYTDQYPEIRRLKEEIAQLEIRIAKTWESGMPAVATGTRATQRGHAPGTASPAMNMVGDREREELRRLRAQLTGLDSEIASLKAEREQTQKNIATMDARVEKVPRREQEMISLSRDYENLKRQYDTILKNKLDAEVAQNLEKRQKGEQFQVLDPANLPAEPFTPNRPKIFGMALIAAFLVGVGGTFGLEVINPTLRSTSDFRHFFDLNILASIPAIRDEIYEKKVRIRRVAIMGGLVSFTVAVTVFLALYGDKARSIVQGIKL